MKANQKFLRSDDEAVSPVIAVILMVAITVVLAATVYVWVSGFGANSSQPAHSMALTSAGPITATDCDGTTLGNQYCKSYTIASASPGLKYSDIKLVLAGTPLTFASSACATAAVDNWAACAGATPRVSTDLIKAGDQIEFEHTTGTSPSGLTLQILDPNSNSVMLTLTVS